MRGLSLLVILFAILDCKVWSIDQIRLWADRLIAKSTHPRSWLIDLSVSGCTDDCVEVVRKAMWEFNVLLPDSTGDLMAGLILQRFDKAELSVEAARHYLVDVVDAYGASCVDAEAAGRLDLTDPTYSGIRDVAEQAMKYLGDGLLSEADRDLIEY